MPAFDALKGREVYFGERNNNQQPGRRDCQRNGFRSGAGGGVLDVTSRAGFDRCPSHFTWQAASGAANRRKVQAVDGQDRVKRTDRIRTSQEAL